ncbi:DUF805 domain-containing protein [Maricaulis sp.]|uniref:DUF805 domain-containing protein n=1 Tax=Maricaulis sp. TaxID=1486257 RepID=UPI002B267C11|nr:DUF805 domain-containing protein [Maricaulis sp.]
MSLNTFILQPADAKRILFGAAGKLSPMEFAQGIIAIIVVNLLLQILSLMPVLGGVFGLVGILVGLASIFAWVCVYSKRFHDAGRSGWLTLAAIGAVIVVSVVVNLVLAPVLGAGAASTGGWPVVTPATVLASSMTSIIANAVVGYFMYKL